MDTLSKVSEFWSKKRGPASESGISPEILAKLQAQSKKPKLETEMSFDGAEIVVPMDEPKVQDMEATVIQADAPVGRENKFGPLNRYLSLGQFGLDMVKPDPERVASINAQLEQLKARQDRPQRVLDLSDIKERMSQEDKRGEWSGDDYLKAALTVALPALAGGLAGGLGGAAGGSQGGVKGIELANKMTDDGRKTGKDKLMNEAEMRVKQFNAESMDEARQAKVILDTVKAELEVNGRLSEPTQKAFDKFLQGYGKIESDLYRDDIDQDLKDKELGLKDQQAQDKLTTQESIADKQIAAMTERANKGLASKEELAKLKLAQDKQKADLDRKSREKVAGQKAKAASSKAAKALKPPSSAQATAAGYAARGEQANQILEMYEQTGNFDPTSFRNWAVNNIVPDAFRSLLSTADQQKYDTVAEDFAQAVLRDESGAVLGDNEIATKKKVLFLQPGENPKEVGPIKAQARRAAIQALRGKAGSQALEGARLPESIKKDPRVEAQAKKMGITYGQAREYYLSQGIKLNEQ